MRNEIPEEQEIPVPSEGESVYAPTPVKHTLTLLDVVEQLNAIQENYNIRMNILFSWNVLLSILVLNLMLRVFL